MITTGVRTSAMPVGTRSTPGDTHAHGEGGGHVVVLHGDHMDYVHGGNRDTAHDNGGDEPPTGHCSGPHGSAPPTRGSTAPCTLPHLAEVAYVQGIGAIAIGTGSTDSSTEGAPSRGRS
ncbi:hypothetical protein E3E14_31205 [Streptomyces sp. ICN441]|nr:hypothetical protein E3E14_31205 [Streptomyces sp. ICN441]